MTRRSQQLSIEDNKSDHRLLFFILFFLFTPLISRSNHKKVENTRSKINHLLFPVLSFPCNAFCSLIKIALLTLGSPLTRVINCWKEHSCTRFPTHGPWFYGHLIIESTWNEYRGNEVDCHLSRKCNYRYKYSLKKYGPWALPAKYTSLGHLEHLDSFL